MILELRIGGGDKGAQTVAPGSVHEDTGEPITWEDDGEPTRIEGNELLKRAKIVASLALLARHWPKEKGSRHHIALRLGGFLARCGWEKEQVGNALEAVAKAAGDAEWQDRKRAGTDARANFKNGGDTGGFPKLREDFEPVADKVAEWLGYDLREQQNERPAKKDVPAPGIGLELTSAADVKMAAVEWVWPNRIAVGKLTLFAGMPDQGKSQILCDITGRITRTLGDKSFPCEEGIAPTGNVIMFSAEDDPADTLVPRLLGAGADLSRVKFVSMVKTEAGRRMFDLAADLAHLRAAIEAVGNVTMVCFDPLNAYFGHGRIDTFRGSDVRAVLGPLSDLAMETKVAVVGLLHFNKKTDVTNVMLRISDSLAFVAAARAVYAVIPDDENQRKLIVRGKNNLAPAAKDKTLAYNITVSPVNDPDSDVTVMAPHILWQPKHVEVTATEAMQAAADDRSPAQVESAMRFLGDLLSEGAVESGEVAKASEVESFSRATLRRASEKLRIEKRKEKGVKDGDWYWRLPDKGHPWPWEVPPG
jgi:putative DNA primase/helicase